MTPFEKKSLSTLPVTDVEKEIIALRVYLRRFMKIELASPDQDYETSRSALLTVCFAAHQLAGLLRVQARGRSYLAERRQVEQWAHDLSLDDQKDDENGAKKEPSV